MTSEKYIFKYNYTFLYQSIAIYATTLIAYLFIRGLLVERDFFDIWRDPVLYLMSAIIILSVLALIYNVTLKRRIEVANGSILLKSSLHETSIEKANVRSIRQSMIRGYGLRKLPVLTIQLKDRRRPIRIRTYNFERSEELHQAVKDWASTLVEERRRLRKSSNT
jgi:hypothetical protein